MVLRVQLRDVMEGPQEPSDSRHDEQLFVGEEMVLQSLGQRRVELMSQRGMNEWEELTVDDEATIWHVGEN